MIGFVIWSVIAVMILVIGILTWRSKQPAGFFTGVTPPKVRDVQKYNHAVAILWFVYAALFELLGIPFLFLKQNAAGFLPVILGVVVITIALPVAYHRILLRYEENHPG